MSEKKFIEHPIVWIYLCGYDDWQAFGHLDKESNEGMCKWLREYGDKERKRFHDIAKVCEKLNKAGWVSTVEADHDTHIKFRKTIPYDQAEKEFKELKIEEEIAYLDWE